MFTKTLLTHGGNTVAAASVTSAAISAPVGTLLLIYTYAISTSSSLGVTDQAGNTWSLSTTAPSTTQGKTRAAWVVVTNALSAQTVTVNWGVSTTGAFAIWQVDTPSGTSATVKDQEAGQGIATATTAWSSTATPATTNANDLVNGFFGTGNTTATITPGGSYVQTTGSPTTDASRRLFSEDLEVVATGAQTATATGPSAAYHGMAIVTKLAGAGPVVKSLAALGVG